MTESPKKGVSPIVAAGVVFIAFIVFISLINSAINPPLVRQFDDAAERARIDACEARKAVDVGNGVKNTEDCRNEN